MARSPVRGSKIKPAASTAVAPKPASIETKPKPAPVPDAPLPDTKPPIAAKPAAVAPVPLQSEAVQTPKAAPIAQPQPATIEKVVESKQETPRMATNFTAATDAKTVFSEASDQARAAVEKGTKVIEEFNDFTKGNVEALVAAGRAAAKGAETIGQNAAEFSRRSFEDATKAVKTITAAKSPTEFFRLQNEFAKSQFDALIAEASKASETFVKIFGDVSEPISTRVSVAADKIKTVVK